jgi:ABC-type branched-subunit amino acid transport system ATPase component
VEPKVQRALELSHRGHVIDNGASAMAGSRAELRPSDQVRQAYLGM